MRLFSKGRGSKTLWTIMVLAVLLAAAACSHTKDKVTYYRLQSISEAPLAKDKGEATAYVELRKAGPNIVTISLTNKNYQSFRIYKQEKGQGAFKPVSTFNPSLPKDIVQNWDATSGRLISFKDPGQSSIDDRYKITPIVNGAESIPLKIAYDTTDGDYFRKIENKGQR
jgi:hypothetical protein